MSWDSRSQRSLVGLLLPAVLLVAAGYRLYRSPRSASHLHITPDSVEYAVGAQRLAALHTYDIVVEGVAYPPRYAPWFSACVLAPAYFLDPGEIGIGIVPVWLLSLAGVLAAYLVGRRLAGEWGGAAACVCLVASGVYRPWSREIMSDVPAAVLGLWALHVYLRVREDGSRRGLWRAAGLLSGAAFLLRIEYALLLVPFALQIFRSREDVGFRLRAMLLPSAIALLATLAYNGATFGEITRSGYQFWVPVPCDYPTMMLSLANVGRGIANATGPWALPDLVLGAAGIAVLLARHSSAAVRALSFLALAALPASVGHLVLPFADARFHVFALAILCILGGAGIAALLPEKLRRAAWIVPLLVAPLAIAWPKEPDPIPERRVAAETLARVLPENAVVVSAIDPVYLEALVLRGTKRRAVPVDREVEYASKAVAWKRIPHPDPPPTSIGDQRAPGLLRAGARDVCAFTAEEEPEQLARWVREGIPVYADLSYRPHKFPEAKLKELGIELERLPHTPWICVLRSAR